MSLAAYGTWFLEVAQYFYRFFQIVFVNDRVIQKAGPVNMLPY